MPYSITHEGKSWKVINSDTGDVKGEHPTEDEAKDQLKALYANTEDVEKSVMGNPVFFIPIQKIDEERREVWGFGSKEEPDRANEIMDFATSKPYFQNWSDMTKQRSGGKSLGNLRSMHSNIAAGKLVAFNVDEANKGFYVGARVEDDNEWRKVRAGVYTGFSIGGSYVKRWPDAQQPGLIRYTAAPAELSLVDAPCVDGATFDVVKGDMVIAKSAFHPEGANSMPIELDELEKVTPGVPAPVATMAAGEKPQGPFNVEQVPNGSVPLVIKDVPDQSTLQTHAVASKDISSELEAWLPKVGQMVKDAVKEALDNRRMIKVVYPKEAPAADAADASRIIKVVRSK